MAPPPPSPTPPQPPPLPSDTPTQPSIQAQRQADYIRFKYGAALTFLIASPILIAIPPRKLDPYTVLLSGAFCVSANHLVREHTGRSIYDRVEARIRRPPTIMRKLPSERAEQVREQLRAGREAQEAQRQMQMQRRGMAASEEGRWVVQDEQHQGSIQESQRQSQDRDKGVAERIWMGGETEGWKERRLREEQKALGEGKGYGDLIKQHIWEVWNWGQSDQSQSQTKDGKMDTAKATTTEEKQVK